MKRSKREHGRILSVETMQRGDALAEDAVAGAMSITVADAGDFEETDESKPPVTAANPLGWLLIGAQTVSYTACDDDTGIITLADPLDAAAEEGDPVYVWSDLYDGVVDYQQALVELDGEYDNPDPVVADVAEGVGALPEGDRGRAGESCTLLQVGDDEWEIVAVGGRPASSRGAGGGAKWEDADGYTLTTDDITAGTATFPLSHRPDDRAIDGKWNGLGQEPTAYTVDYDAQTITWPLAGFEEVGDRLTVHYTYQQGISTPVVPYSDPTLVVDPATDPTTFFIPASLLTFISTGTNTEGHGDTDLGHVGSANYPTANFQGSNRGKAGPKAGLPPRVPGMRFFIVGDWSEPHTFSSQEPYEAWVSTPEVGAPGFQLFYSSQLTSNQGGRELTTVTITGPDLPAGTVRGVEVFSNDGAGEASAVAGFAAGDTNVQVAAWGTPRTKPGVHARQWAVNITGVVLIYPEGTV